MIIKEPVETMMSNFLGMKYLLDYAKEQGTERILYISSSEVYGEKEGSEPYKEGQYGYIDLLNSRNSYSVGKRAAETLCASYADEYGMESVIVRPGHIYGPTASPFDKRVASAWSYAVAKGEDIVMKSDGSQIRSYCYCLDCASAMLKVLLCGENCHAYNISNPDSIISIKDMAEILSESAGVKLRMELPTEEEKKGFNPMSNSSLESESLTGLGWHGCFDAKTGFAHTVKILKETYDL
jgi:nucleoside-diphosphate-sugar epimerase